MGQATMNKHFKSIFFLVLAIELFCSACVSVDLKGDDPKRSKDVRFSAPQNNYSVLEDNQLDHAWRNPKTGNTISFLSECKSGNDPSFQNIRDGVTSGVSDINIERSEMIEFNQRKALSSRLGGAVDGILTKLEILILKKNDCIYVLTYVGLPESFDSDLNVFESFKREFKAP